MQDLAIGQQLISTTGSSNTLSLIIPHQPRLKVNNIVLNRQVNTVLFRTLQPTLLPYPKSYSSL